jgi:predicted Rossmann-fold nucleotide-binding protein
MVSDVTAATLQPGLAEHPFMEKYRHVMKPGQAFPGSEMALIERTTNMDTLFHDINRAFDDMESKGIKVDRRIEFQAMIYAFPLNQQIPANPTEEDIKFVAVSGSQIYDIRKTPLPLNFSGNDLDSYLALKDFPDTSIAEMQLKGRMIERTHYARAYEALERVLKFPKKEVFSPAIQRVAKDAVVLTDRHFLGTWTKPGDVFTKAQLRDLESHGYRFGEVWDGPRDIDGIEEFRKGAHAFITLPYTYANVFNKEDLLRTKLERLLMILGRDVDDELSDPYVRGRPHLVLDPEYRRVKAFAYRMGLSGKVPAWDSHIKSFGDDLGRVLNSLWVHSEYVHSPHIPQWESLPDMPRSPKDVNIAMLGSAKSWNRTALRNSRAVTAAYHDAGYGIIDGYGGEGHMNEFAQAAVDRFRAGHKDDWRLGITTPLAFIEKEPKGLERTHLAAHNISMPSKTERMKAIFAQASFGHMRPGGLGTTEEGVYNMVLNVNGADCPLIVDSECLPFRGKHFNAYGAFNRMFTDWERARAQTYVVEHALKGKAIIDRHVEERRQKGRKPQIA